ncbi:MAG: DinB family protein [Chloroflexota bacterium]
MLVTEYAANAVSTAFDALEQVMTDVAEEQAWWVPPGQANPIGALYLHTLYDVDAIVNRMFQDRPPLWDSVGFGARIGGTIDLNLELEWARVVRFDLAVAREYARVVHAAALNYIQSLTPEDFDRIIPSQLSERTTLGQLIHTFVVWHVDVHCGEISALKGVQGLKGYSF